MVRCFVVRSGWIGTRGDDGVALRKGRCWERGSLAADYLVRTMWIFTGWG